MRIQKVVDVKGEVRRFMNAIEALDKANPKAASVGNFYYDYKRTGAVRRASMDLTRALAELRKY